MLTKVHCTLFVLILCVHLQGSLWLSEKVYATSKCIIDEIFHLPQGLAYCNHEFKRWDPKITTLPGLYLLSTALCSPAGACSIYCMRLTNIIASVVNMILFFAIHQQFNPTAGFYKSLLTSINLSLLPPLLFFSQVFYTDVPSLTFVLAVLYFGMAGNYLVTSVFGVLAILLRQTNVVYLLLVAGIRLVGLLYAAVFKPNSYLKNDFSISAKELRGFLRWRHSLKYLINGIFKLHPYVFLEIISYGVIFISFLIFVRLNGGIVVGDKQAHPATLHLPQIFYFALFTTFFAWPHFVEHIMPFLTLVKQYKKISFLVLSLILGVIHVNTIVHPYLLADNRHYVFYIWNRLFSNLVCRYLWSPVYLFALFGLLRKSLSQTDTRFSMFYIPCTMASMCLQGLIEIRYYLTPFVILRLHFSNVTYKTLTAELLFYIAINFITLRTFFTKEIIWMDFEDTQRLIW